MAEDESKISLVTEALEKEGKKWKRLSDDMSPIKGNIESLDLSELSFFISPAFGADAIQHHASYDEFQEFMVKAVGGRRSSSSNWARRSRRSQSTTTGLTR